MFVIAGALQSGTERSAPRQARGPLLSAGWPTSPLHASVSRSARTRKRARATHFCTTACPNLTASNVSNFFAYLLSVFDPARQTNVRGTRALLLHVGAFTYS